MICEEYIAALRWMLVSLEKCILSTVILTYYYILNVILRFTNYHFTKAVSRITLSGNDLDIYS